MIRVDDEREHHARATLSEALKGACWPGGHARKELMVLIVRLVGKEERHLVDGHRASVVHRTHVPNRQDCGPGSLAVTKCA